MDRDTALRELSQGIPESRQQAARLLGRWADREVLDALIDALASSHRGVREAASDTLLEVGDGETARRLLPMLRHDIPATRNAARLLLQRLAKAAPEILDELSRDPDARMRIFAANIIGETGDHDLAQLLIVMVGDADENVRDAAIVGLGRLGAPEAVPQLEYAAARGPAWIQLSAIDALGQVPESAAVHALIRLLSEAPEDVQGPVIEALGRQGASEAVLPLIQKLQEAPSLGPVVVATLSGRMATVTLAASGVHDRRVLTCAIVETLTGLEDDAEEAVGPLALLARIGVAIDAAPILRFLLSGHPDVQRAAVVAALKLRLSDAVPLLRDLERNGDPALGRVIRAGLAEPGKETL